MMMIMLIITNDDDNDMKSDRDIAETVGTLYYFKR